MFPFRLFTSFNFTSISRKQLYTSQHNTIALALSNLSFLTRRQENLALILVESTAPTWSSKIEDVPQEHLTEEESDLMALYRRLF